MNGVLLELGFLKRLRESSLWPRVGSIYGTSAGALTGTMAALDRLDEMEEFALGLQPRDIFCPQRLWRLPLNGLHEYALPATIAERLLDPIDLARSLAAAPIEVVVFATDVSEREDARYALSYSSHETPPETMAQAVLASAAISARRPAATRRGPDRDRRRLGPELPARVCARPARRRAGRRLPLRPELPAPRRRVAGTPPPAPALASARSRRCARSSPSSTRQRHASSAASRSTSAT